MLFAALFALPVTGWSQEEAAHAVAQPQASAVSLNLHGDVVREILRATAREESAAMTAAEHEPIQSRLPPLALRFRSDERIDHVDCDELQCYAYAKDDRILYTKAREPRVDMLSVDSTTSEAWLSCQDTNDMLSTFERFDRCRGIGISLTVPWIGGPNGINAPPRR
jgi:hypothetical protein